MSVLLVLGVGTVSWALTGWFRRYAIARRLLDVPNARSSHAVPTPRGGGLAVAASATCAFSLLAVGGILPWPLFWALVGGGTLAAVVGFIDDHGHVPPKWRLLGHVGGAAWILLCLGGPPAVSIFGFTLLPGPTSSVLLLLYVVWLLNLTNFMDGIDGLAAVETITVSIGGALLYTTVAGSTPWVAPLVMAGAAAGFLVWNWPPAMIFLGDAGSGFIGIVLATLSLQAAGVAAPLFWSWVILLGVFIVDATLTLGRRMLRGERFYEAHRTHAYQQATRGRSHAAVTLTVCAINLAWLFPLAVLVAKGTLDGALGVVIAYAPLMAAAWWLEAAVASRP
ncbi:MAG: glycosyltransferase family 4 protein [Acidobacteriota bacterium]|nr:glycosyltransferase family 4 protein [Acidobacteriota bacterium]